MKGYVVRSIFRATAFGVIIFCFVYVIALIAVKANADEIRQTSTDVTTGVKTTYSSNGEFKQEVPGTAHDSTITYYSNGETSQTFKDPVTGTETEYCTGECW